jgi:hypothetical protein
VGRGVGFGRARGGPAVLPPPRAFRARRGTRLACRSLYCGVKKPSQGGFPPQGVFPPLGGFPPRRPRPFLLARARPSDGCGGFVGGSALRVVTASLGFGAASRRAPFVFRLCLSVRLALCLLCLCCVASGGGSTVLRARSCVGVWGLPLPRGLCRSLRPGNAGGWLVAGVGLWFVCAWFGVGGVWLCIKCRGTI